MNVLGKIKSKKPKPDEDLKQIKSIQIQEQKLDPIISQSISQQPLPKGKEIKSQKFFEKLEKPKLTKPLFEQELIVNTNVISKHKEKSLKQYDSELMKTTNSFSNSFNSVFQTKKQSKKAGVYFEDIPSVRNNSIASNQNSNDRSKHSNQEESIMNDDEFNFDFDFLLSHRQKRQIKKSFKLSRGKVEDLKQIQEELKQQNQQVLSFFIRKWSLYGDIYMFQGELESLKRKYIEIQKEQEKVKVYDRIKIKLSCGRQIIVGPQTIGRIFISNVIFLSENQAMIPPEFLLKTIEKNKRRGKNN